MAWVVREPDALRRLTLGGTARSLFQASLYTVVGVFFSSCPEPLV
jgi:hypothetical protein